MAVVIDRIGQRFGRLLVTGRWPINAPTGQAVWECRCECGNGRLVRTGDLQSGNTRSCGCLQPEVASRAKTTHGHTRGHRRTREYEAWIAMLRRCYDTQTQNYPRYGGRGITVCQAWRESFTAFLDDVGLKPDPKMSLDRIDNDGPYEPGNVRWATVSEQNRNQRPRRSSPRGPYGPRRR